MQPSLPRAAAWRGRLPLRSTAWESICLRCGLCCYEKEVAGSLIVTNYSKPCHFLDTSTHMCTVYDTRFAVCANCRRMTLWHALFVSWLPKSCGYVQRFRRRRGGK
jgi:uncharacterized protein